MTRIARLVFVALLAMPLTAFAADEGSEPTPAERADAAAERIHDAPAFVSEVENAVEMARDGVYGRLARGGMERVERARDLIVDLLEGRDSAMELGPEDRIALFNAQEVIRAELNSDQKSRKVCKREPVIGSRLPKTVCLTVAEREARAQASREGTEELFRSVCHAGPGNACSRD